MSQQRLISPDRDALSGLRTPLEKGEGQVLDFFDELLDPAWEIYVQPFMNGLRPDFVLLNPSVGAAVFEVKDWDLEAQDYCPDERPGWLRVRDFRTNRDYRKRSPFDKAKQYAAELRDIYCPRLGEPANIPLLTAGVIFTRASTEQARALCRPELDQIPASGLRYTPVSGVEALEGRDLSVVFPESRRTSSSLMDDELVADLRRWLVEPQHAVEQRNTPAMDARQRHLASTRTPSGYRRIRGPAGSGKTMVVAARAATLVGEGHSVLVVSFNHTLRNYLMDMYVRFGRPRNAEGAVWLGFHEWCKRTMIEAGREREYRELWGRGDEDDGRDVLSFGLAQATLNALQDGPFRGDVPTYDAILVDEGQDFLPGWWAALRKVLNPGGEMLLVADRAQDIYERNASWTEQAMEGAGFRGDWSELNIGYRMPERLQALSDQFAEAFGLDGTKREARPAQGEFEFCTLRWHQVEPDRLPQALMAEFHDLAAAESEFSMTDINFIVDTKELGGKLVSSLEGAGVKTVNTFGANAKAERAAKHAFFKGAERVKVTTVHSFKGWETPVLIVGISSGGPELVYTALSRLKGSEAGSHLHVVCGNDRFSDFGKDWETRGPEHGDVR